MADSQRSCASANAYSYRDLETNLRLNGLDIHEMPQVVQFNKRDLQDIKSLEEIREAWKGTGIPTVPASATQGVGVLETLEALLIRLNRHLDQGHSFSSKFGLDEEHFIAGVMRNHIAEKEEA